MGQVVHIGSGKSVDWAVRTGERRLAAELEQLGAMIRAESGDPAMNAMFLVEVIEHLDDYAGAYFGFGPISAEGCRARDIFNAQPA